MQTETAQKGLNPLFKRWGYMVLAIVASVVLLYHPVFNFQDDKGIIYIRSFEMTKKAVYVTQTDIQSGVKNVVAGVSVKGLYYCNIAMIAGCIACLLCFFNPRWRIGIAMLTALIAGAYYLFMIIYAIQIADQQCATLAPNMMVIFPAIVCQMMILTRRSILQERAEEDEAPE